MAIPYNIKYNNLKSSNSLEKFVTKHLAKLDTVVDDNDTSAKASIELSKEVGNQNNGDIYVAEINLHTAKGEFHALERSDDIRKAVDQMRERIVREVRSATQRMRDLRRRGARSIKAAFNQAALG